MKTNDDKLFVELSWEDYDQLNSFVNRLISNGDLPCPTTSWAKEWLERFAPDYLSLGMSPTMLLYILLSIRNFLEDRVDYSMPEGIQSSN